MKAIFSESSLPPKTAEAIGRQAGVKVEAGEDSLYGDTLGPAGSAGATYLDMERHNTDHHRRRAEGLTVLIWTHRTRSPRWTWTRSAVAYGTRRLALENIDGMVAPGEAVALIGPNGAGKSTLIKASSASSPSVGPDRRAGRGRPRRPAATSRTSRRPTRWTRSSRSRRRRSC